MLFLSFLFLLSLLWEKSTTVKGKSFTVAGGEEKIGEKWLLDGEHIIAILNGNGHLFTTAFRVAADVIPGRAVVYPNF